jgi:hypothetical protein
MTGHRALAIEDRCKKFMIEPDNAARTLWEERLYKSVIGRFCLPPFAFLDRIWAIQGTSYHCSNKNYKHV